MVAEIDVAADIAGNLVRVHERIAIAASDAGRSPDAVTLVAVTKFHTADRVREALQAGHRVFGENRVQDAEVKYPDLKREYPDLRLHAIAPLQRNKVRRAVALFDVIETLDRPRIARAIASEMEEAGCRPDGFIEVNTGEEPQKGGVLPAGADAFIRLCRDDLGLPVLGLMCVPPLGDEPSLHFALLREIAARNELQELSMGMTADFEIAIRFGATLVRLGTAIFGERRSFSPSPD
jgi:pyridoxal phosphate enzyme (YggS family)